VTTDAAVARATASATGALLGRPWAWLCVLGIAAADAAGAAASDVTVTHTLRPMLASLLLLAVAVAYRLADRNLRIAEMTEAAALWIAFSAAGCVLTYLCARLDWPLRDAALVRLDRALGFDWTAWWRWTGRHHVATLLALAYASLPAQLVLCCVVLPLLDGDRTGELFWTALLSLLVAAAIAGLLPADGAYVSFGLADRADWLADARLLRSGAPATFMLPAMKGIVALPSYHTVLGVLFIYSWRGAGGLTVAATAWNLLMIVATVTAGSHYVTDVIAGLALAVATIAAVRGVRQAFGHSAIAPG